MNNMRKEKREKGITSISVPANKNLSSGITLVALVVTIVVLLILAAVTLNLVIGNNGIISRAKDAKNATAQGKVNEETDINNLYDEMEHLLQTNSDEESSINWSEIITNINTKYDEYLEEARTLGQTTETNIAIGTDGKVVNLDLWHYYKTDDGTGMSLGQGDGCTYHRGYDEENLIHGKVQGKMPQYIYMKSENKVYPVTMLAATFVKNSNITEIPEIPLTVTSIGSQTFDSCDNLISVEIPESVTQIRINGIFAM